MNQQERIDMIDTEIIALMTERQLLTTRETTLPATAASSVFQALADTFYGGDKEACKVALRGECRLRQVVRLRRIFALCLRGGWGASLTRVGTLLDRDHTTVHHYCATADQLEQEAASQILKGLRQ